MNLLINIALVSSPFIGLSGLLWLLYVMFGRKTIKIVGFFQLLIVFFWVVSLLNSPLIRPTATLDINQDMVHQLESEAGQAGKVEDLILDNKEEKVEVKTKYKKYEPEL